MIPKEIHSSLSKVGQCSMALEVMLSENSGRLKRNGATRVSVEPVLTFTIDDMVEAEDIPLKRIRRSGNNSSPDLGPASSSLKSDVREVI